MRSDIEIAQAARMDFRVPMLLPGITVTTTPTDYGVVNRFQIQRFEGGRWVPVGQTISGE